MLNTKEEWLTTRQRIMQGQLTQEDLTLFYDLFLEHCAEDYKQTDLTTFQAKFTEWFNNPVFINSDGMPTATTQNGIIISLFKYLDAKFHVVYLLDKDNKLLNIL
jgi:hypothetical protein